MSGRGTADLDGQSTDNQPRAAERLYDLFAHSYDSAFDAPGLRQTYEALAWDWVKPLLPAAGGSVLDIGCGTGRWLLRLQDLGLHVTAVEPSAEMRARMPAAFVPAGGVLSDAPIERFEAAPGAFDLVLIMGSGQYFSDLGGQLARVHGWLKPGGTVCLHVDGLKALFVELSRLGRLDEAMARIGARSGIFTFGSVAAEVHLHDVEALQRKLTDAGFADVQTRGLLIEPVICGRDACEVRAATDAEGYLAAERRLSAQPPLADFGKHLLAWARKPPAG